MKGIISFLSNLFSTISKIAEFFKDNAIRNDVNAKRDAEEKAEAIQRTLETKEEIEERERQIQLSETVSIESVGNPIKKENQEIKI